MLLEIVASHWTAGDASGIGVTEYWGLKGLFNPERLLVASIW